MGKKGKKGGKKSGKSGKKSAATGVAPSGGAEEEKETPKEVLLKDELDSLTLEVEKVRTQVELLRKENDFLQKEADTTRNETHEYMSYMSKRANKRQETIVSLNDWNQKELANLAQQKQNLLDKYDAEKNNLKSVILEREQQLQQIKNDIDELGKYKILQEEQRTKITLLKSEVMRQRGEQTEKIQQIRASCLKEKQDFRHESEKRITEMKMQASQEATRSLQMRTGEIKKENRDLRQELMELIQKSQALQAHKRELQEQKKVLEQEEEYSRDIKKIKQNRKDGNVAT